MMLILGVILGLLFGTMFESVGHKFFGHPSPWQLRLYFRYPKLFDPLLRCYYHHFVIHHELTFQTHPFLQFESEDAKRRVDDWIKASFPEDFSSLVFRERYNLTLVGIQGTLPFALPFTAGPLIIGSLFGWQAALGSLLTSFTPVLMSKFIHPLVHEPRNVSTAGPIARTIARSRYMHRIVANHYLHHVHLDFNFNLLLGGDHLVGLYRKPTEKELWEIRELCARFDELSARSSPERRRSYRAVAKVGAFLLALFLPATLDAGAADKTKGGYPTIESKELYDRGVRSYISLQHPTFEQRFSFQRWHSGAVVLPEVKAEIDEARLDYGLNPDAYDIKVSEWSKRAEFQPEAYQLSGEGVLFRGQQLQPGDLFLTNLASDSDGVFTTLTDRPNSFSHVAVFVMLPGNLPAVVEIHDEGVRAVPLKFFLSDRFSSYVEIYRYNNLGAESKAALGGIALQLTSEQHGFDFYLDDKQTNYLTCALTANELFRRAGVEPMQGESRYSTAALPNLRVLGNENGHGRTLLMPDDFTRSPRTRLVGVIDNGRFDKVQARALIRDRFQELFQTKILDEKLFPYDYHVYRFAVGTIQAHGWFSPVLLTALGFHERNFPSGPAVFLSLTKPALERMEHASRTLHERLPHEKLMQHTSFSATEADTEVRLLVLEASRDLADLFRDRD